MSPRLATSLRGLVAVTACALAFGEVAPAPLEAQVEVRLTLPQRARLDLTDKETVTVAPFLVISQEGQDTARTRSIDVEREFERYLLKVLRRETDLEVVEPGTVEYPTFDLDRLLEERDFWESVGRRTQADLIVAGSLDFDIQDRTGYRTQEFRSPLDGRVYQRQVLVEQTGFEYDILMVVVDGGTGEVLYRDNFKDFQNFQSDEADPLAGMFENLYSLEDRILGIFTQKEVEATRILFVNN